MSIYINKEAEISLFQYVVVLQIDCTQFETNHSFQIAAHITK